MRLSKNLIILSFFFAPTLAFSQGALLDDGESGGGFLAGTALSSEGSFFHGGAIATLSGRLDIGALVSRELFDKYNYKATALGVWAEFYGLREDLSNKIPLSMSISYQVSGTSSRSFATFGMSIYKRVGESRRSFIQPALSFFYTLPTRGLHTSALGFGLGISVVSRISRSAVFSFTPTFVNIHDEKSGGITFGLMFSDANRKKARTRKFEF